MDRLRCVVERITYQNAENGYSVIKVRATGFYDPFGGSGTTLIACEDNGAQAYVMELTPGYTDVIVERYIRHTGRADVKCIRNGRELTRAEIMPLLSRAIEGGETG